MKRKVLANLCIIAVIMFCATTAWGSVLLGTTGDGCRYTPDDCPGSTLVEIVPATGATLRTIGPVGYVVNGLEYDATTGKLYGSTSVSDPVYNGLIEIDIYTGAGTPIGVHKWGLEGEDEGNPVNNITAVNNITVDSTGQMFGWWEPEDDLVRIDKDTGIATRVGESGVKTWENGLDFDSLDTLYMVNFKGESDDTPGGIYTVNPSTGAATETDTGFIGTSAHHGDFDLSSNLYYGISESGGPRSLVVADLSTELPENSTFADLDDSIHTLTFVRDCEFKLGEANVLIDNLYVALADANATIATLTDDLAAANDNIEALEAENDQLQMVMDSLVAALLKKSNADANAANAVKILAQEAIDQAINEGGKAKEIDKALKEMAKALKELDHTKKDGTLDPKYDKAIDHYKKAWEHAQHAMKKLPKPK
jgi:hypothetical protein